MTEIYWFIGKVWFLLVTTTLSGAIFLLCLLALGEGIRSYICQDFTDPRKKPTETQKN